MFTKGKFSRIAIIAKRYKNLNRIISFKACDF